MHPTYMLKNCFQFLLCQYLLNFKMILNFKMHFNHKQTAPEDNNMPCASDIQSKQSHCDIFKQALNKH